MIDLHSRISPNRAAFAGIFVTTMLGLLTIGATLPVLPRYVTEELGGSDLEVGIVTGAFAFTGLAARPLAGHFADTIGRRPTVVVGALLTAIAGALYFLPFGIPGLIVARLFLGAGEGSVYTAGSAWVVDLAPPDRRGQVIGLYGLAIWGGLSLGPPIGELLLQAFSFEIVWTFAAVAPLIGAVVASRIPESYAPAEGRRGTRPRATELIAREAVRSGIGLALAIVGYATLAAFIVLHLDAQGIGHGAAVFTAFAVTVVLGRIIGGSLPDRFGAARTAAASGLIEATGLAIIAVAGSLPVAIAGALVMGLGFSILFPSLALAVIERVGEQRRGAGMGTFTAFFDIGVGAGAPLAGLVAAIGGYGWAFAFAAALSLAAAAVGASQGKK